MHSAGAAVWVALWSDRRTGRRLEDERRIAQERDQLAEAYRVQVALAEKAAGTPDPVYGERDPSVKVLTATVVNRGAHTITGIEGRFRLAGGSGSLVSPGKIEWLSGFPDLPERLRAGAGSAPDFNPWSDRLAPWDTGIRFESEPMADSRVPGAYPVVRWTDRWLTRWDYRQGEVCKIEQGAAWKP